jgi:hypothetical protein
MGWNSKSAIALLAILALLGVAWFYFQHNRQLQSRRDVQQISTQIQPALKRIPVQAGPALPQATKYAHANEPTAAPISNPVAELRRTHRVRIVEAAAPPRRAVATRESSDQSVEDSNQSGEQGRYDMLSSAPQSNSLPQTPKVDVNPEQLPATNPTEVPLAANPRPPPSDMAMLHGNGKALLNGTPTADRALFPGDSIETNPDTFANITGLGSAVLVQPGSLLRFQGNSVEVERGGVAITTSKGMTARVDDMTVSPAENGTAKFEVINNADSIDVAAYNGSVLLSDGSGTTLLAQGQHTTKEKKKKRKATGAVPGSTGAVAKKTAFILLGAGGATAAVLAILKENSERSTPISPSKP